MWKWLHPFAKSERCYQLCHQLAPWFGLLGLVLIVIGTIWGMAYAPMDYQQGNSFRIIYIHVPAAMLSMGIYLSMAIAAFVAMVWQIKLSETYIIAVAPVGIAFTMVALFTGAVWGKPMWGAWWVWDARLTSELILLFLYIGILSLYNAFEDSAAAGKATCILTLVGSVNLPIIHYSVEWWNTLHQGATLTKGAITMDMGIPLVINIFGFGFFVAYVSCIRMANEIVEREKHRPWVRDMFSHTTPSINQTKGA